jgi:hypothetical protein
MPSSSRTDRPPGPSRRKDPALFVGVKGKAFFFSKKNRFLLLPDSPEAYALEAERHLKGNPYVRQSMAVSPMRNSPPDTGAVMVPAL